MEEIKLFGVGKFHMEEAQTFHFHSLENLSAIVDQSIKKYHDDYKVKYSTYDVAMKESGGKDPYTTLIRKADSRSLKAYEGIARQIKLMLTHYDQHISEYARLAYIIINKYDYPKSMSYMSKVGIYTNLIQDLQAFNNTYVDDRPSEITLDPYDRLKQLCIDGWVQELNESKEELMNIYTQRYKKKGTQTSGVSVTSRKDVDNAYRLLVKQINALITLEGVGKYREVINNQNALIDSQRPILLARETKNGNKANEKPSDKPEDIPSDKPEEIKA